MNGWTTTRERYPAKRPAQPAPTQQRETDSLATLQRAVGNQALQAVARAGSLPSEVTRALVARHGNQAIQRLAQALQRRADESPDERPGEAPALGERIRAAQGRGAPLDPGMRGRLGQGLGADLSAVRVHTDEEADHLSQAVDAVAFTSGADIFFRSGTYDPHSAAGTHLLAHEVTHAVQQARGPVAGTPAPGGVAISDPSDHFERKAEATAAPLLAAAVAQRPAATAGPDDAAAGPLRLQRHALGRSALAAAVAQAHGTPVPIQRHSSWEHKILGDIKPEDLQVIAAGRDVKEAEQQSVKGATVQLGGVGGNRAVNMANVLHVLEQEIRRLTYFRNVPPRDASPQEVKRLQDLDRESRVGQAQKKMDKATTVQGKVAGAQGVGHALSADATWQVTLVEISFADGKKDVVSYGEMNTLADIFGTPEEISRTDSKRFHQILQGIRQQTLLNMMELHKEISGKNKYASKLNPLKVGEGFSGTVGSTGRGPSLAGELRLMGVLGRGKLAEGENILPKSGKQETSYTSTLGRNACHFAPESWHSWASYHQKAEQFAQVAWTAKQKAEGNRAQLETAQKNPDEKMGQKQRIQLHQGLMDLASNNDEAARLAANQALLQNGFGDHYLQDSYAAGHLINKTEIMKWFVNWVAANPRHLPILSEDKWRRLQAVANQQGGIGAVAAQYDKDQPGQIQARDPQSVENRQGDWQDRFGALGLTIPTSVRVGTPGQKALLYWQQTPGLFNKMTPRKLQEHEGLGANAASNTLDAMVRDGVARETDKTEKGTGQPLFTLEERYRPHQENQARFSHTAAKLKHGDDTEKQKGAQGYERMTAAVTYADYHEFLNNAYLQASTNVLHDKFCLEGLDVTTAANQPVFKVYGDDSMLQKGSAHGVGESARTAEMSRNRIRDLIATGHSAHQMTDISTRFPSHVEWAGHVLSLAGWHTGGTLKALCESELFRQAAESAKGWATRQKGDVGKISKDDIKRIHQGEAF